MSVRTSWRLRGALRPPIRSLASIDLQMTGATEGWRMFWITGHRKGKPLAGRSSKRWRTGCSSGADSTNDGSNIPSSASRPPEPRRHRRCATSWHLSFSANKLGWRALRLLVATRVNVRSLQDFGGLAAKAWPSDRGSFGTRHGQIRDAFRQSMPDFWPRRGCFPGVGTVLATPSAKLCHVNRPQD